MSLRVLLAASERGVGLPDHVASGADAAVPALEDAGVETAQIRDEGVELVGYEAQLVLEVADDVGSGSGERGDAVGILGDSDEVGDAEAEGHAVQ